MASPVSALAGFAHRLFDECGYDGGMTVLRNLLMRAARRVASDPEARAKAAKLAQRAKPTMQAALKQAKAIRDAPDSAREAGRLAGRLKRRYLDSAEPE